MSVEPAATIPAGIVLERQLGSIVANRGFRGPSFDAVSWFFPGKLWTPTILSTCYDPALDPTAIEPVSVVVFGLIGLLGGAHCLGMCGPLVSTYSDRLRARRDGGSRRAELTVGMVRQHALFNLGRATSYAILGGVFGAAGAVMFVTPRAVTAVATDVHSIAGILVGTIIVAMGVHYLVGRGLLGGSISLPLIGPLFGRVHRWLLGNVDAWVGNYRIVGLGAVHGLLPCPLLYPAFLYAFVRGSPLEGVVALGVLGLGTIPSMFLYGTLFQSLSPATRAKLHRVLGVAFVVLGYVPLQHGLATLGVPLPSVPLPHYQPL
ncbi:sulfite exporter TauE/SafE family protein [Natrarchaeobius chitinivorans]|uniref:Sulfite exporter TauE/SafE family protein n=1 Tax=Natrarchaeobius chitinivorans TaxID=1679083 RepID=A0A3N6LV38_NATCH|nr:sulfite exporter TauE/SafE family protein [Natrarchaeobius chitinivorans]RQG94203.1 sulfite exporter TauE/SafE family protein [Natrarchaeobius chitinivorans]